MIVFVIARGMHDIHSLRVRAGWAFSGFGALLTRGISQVSQSFRWNCSTLLLAYCHRSKAVQRFGGKAAGYQ